MKQLGSLAGNGDETKAAPLAVAASADIVVFDGVWCICACCAAK